MMSRHGSVHIFIMLEAAGINTMSSRLLILLNSQNKHFFTLLELNWLNWILLFRNSSLQLSSSKRQDHYTFQKWNSQSPPADTTMSPLQLPTQSDLNSQLQAKSSSLLAEERESALRWSRHLLQPEPK